MHGPMPAPNYPAEDKLHTLRFLTLKESAFIHNVFDIFVIKDDLDFGICIGVIGASAEDQEYLLVPIVFKDSFEVKTSNYGVIKFPEDFSLVGEL